MSRRKTCVVGVGVGVSVDACLPFAIGVDEKFFLCCIKEHGGGAVIFLVHT